MLESEKIKIKTHRSKTHQPSKRLTTRIFDNELQNINYKVLKALIIKLKTSCSCTDLNTLNSITEELEANSSLFANENKNKSKVKTVETKTYHKYPQYKKGSFQKDIKNFLNTNPVINDLYIKIEEEINKIYKGYILTENDIYEKMNTIMNFYESKENYNDLQIVSRIKEISEILKETKKMVNNYIFYNFDLLIKLLNLIDTQLSKFYNVKSISLYFLLNIFDLPNNELSYILMFKIIDEECTLLKYVTKQLENQIKYPRVFLNDDPSREISITEINKEDKEDKEEKKDIENSLLPYDEEENSSESEDKKIALLNLMETYTNKVYQSIDDISNCNDYRAKYKNYFIYLKGNFNLSILDDVGIDDENIMNKKDSKTEDFLPINSLMDEEVIIKKFLDKETVNKFLDHFKKNLSFKYKMDEFLIILHSFQNIGFSIPIIFWHNSDIDENIAYNCLYIIFYYLGKFFGKILGRILTKKFFKLKSLLIISYFLMIISLVIPFIKFDNNKINYILMCSRFLYGFSYFSIIEINFLLKYVPKLLLVKIIKKHYCLKYLYICIGLLITALINKFYTDLFFVHKIDFLNKIFIIDNINQNKNEFIFLIFSVIMLFINLICFKNLKYSDIIKYNKTDKDEMKANLKKSTGSDKSDEKRSVLSYGKSKIISKKNLKKVKLIDEQFRESVKGNIYEGNNYIFFLLSKLIKNENESNCSKTNKTSFGFLFLLFCTMINHLIIIFSVPLIVYNSKPKNNLWIYSISYLLSFIIYFFKEKLIKGLTNKILKINIILITIIISQIIFNVVFFLIIKFNPDNFEQKALIMAGIIIIILNNIIEIFCLQLMNQIIPIEKIVCGTIITNFIDINEIIGKGILMLIIFLIYNYIKSEIKIIIISCLGMILSILGGLIYIIVNFKVKSSALVRIMNKISYESL